MAKIKEQIDSSVGILSLGSDLSEGRKNIFAGDWKGSGAYDGEDMVRFKMVSKILPGKIKTITLRIMWNTHWSLRVFCAKIENGQGNDLLQVRFRWPFPQSG